MTREIWRCVIVRKFTLLTKCALYWSGFSIYSPINKKCDIGTILVSTSLDSINPTQTIQPSLFLRLTNPIFGSRHLIFHKKYLSFINLFMKLMRHEVLQLINAFTIISWIDNIIRMDNLQYFPLVRCESDTNYQIDSDTCQISESLTLLGQTLGCSINPLIHSCPPLRRR